jgi:sulfide:quinone oxidoreductase
MPTGNAFLADYYFHLKGVREQIDITLVTPFEGAFTKPNASRVLSRIAEQKGIDVVPNFQLERHELRWQGSGEHTANPPRYADQGG